MRTVLNTELFLSFSSVDRYIIQMLCNRYVVWGDSIFHILQEFTWYSKKFKRWFYVSKKVAQDQLFLSTLFRAFQPCMGFPVSKPELSVSAATNTLCIFRDLLKLATQHWPGCLWAKQQKSLCPRTTFYWNHLPLPCSKSCFSTSPSSFYIWPIYLPSYVPNFLPKEEHTLERHCAVRANTQQNPVFVCSVVLHNCHAQS